MNARSARAWHGLTFVVVLAALVLQFVLVVQGAAILDETDPPGLGTRILRFFSYFTVQSNILVAVVTGQLAANPHRDGAVWRVARLDAVVAIAVTGLVHWFLLRPLLSLTGLSALADTLLHLVVPGLAVLGWLAFGPRPRVRIATIRGALLWPVAWLVSILILGALTGWYPYPFIDVGEHGYPQVLLTSAAVTVLFLALAGGARLVDRALPPAPSAPQGQPE